MKLSVIIPVYNVAPYLRKCVESVVNQDLAPEEYEVILVDDGSTDGSGGICDSFSASQSLCLSAHQPNINVIHQPNAGLSAARNTGIMAAKGEYIQFVDSDDYLEPNVLGELVRQMDEEKLDVLRFDYQNVRIVGEAYEVFEPYKHPRVIDQCTKIVDGETYLNTRMQTACYAVQFMLRRSLIVDSIHQALNIGFTPNIYFEDTDWTPRMLMKAERVNSTTTIVYNYLMREGSITKAIATDKQRKVLEDKIRLIGALQEMSVQAEDRRWFKRMIDETVLSALSIVALQFWGERKKYWNQLEALRVYPLSASGYKYKLINISPKLYCTLIRLKNK